jgi:hypothetical protein
MGLEYTWGYIKEFNYVASSNGIKYPYKIKNIKKKKMERREIFHSSSNSLCLSRLCKNGSQLQELTSFLSHEKMAGAHLLTPLNYFSNCQPMS